jgi:integrase/recombinase XerD
MNLQSSDIIVGIDGNNWIHLNRTKTGTLTKVPLIGPTEEIIRRYKNHPRTKKKGTLLPVITNQPMNRALKEISLFVGIEKNISSHTGRHSFATSVTAGHGVPIETISKMLGHCNLKTTQIYSKITDSRLASDAAALVAKIS